MQSKLQDHKNKIGVIIMNKKINIEKYNLTNKEIIDIVDYESNILPIINYWLNFKTILLNNTKRNKKNDNH